MAASSHILKELLKGIDFSADNMMVLFDVLPNKHLGWVMYVFGAGHLTGWRGEGVGWGNNVIGTSTHISCYSPVHSLSFHSSKEI